MIVIINNVRYACPLHYTHTGQHNKLMSVCDVCQAFRAYSR